MGAFDELRSTGSLGPDGARLLYRLVQAVALARNFPPPDGYAQWSKEAALDIAHDFIDGPRGRRRLADLVVRATDEASFEALLSTAVLNFHRDRSRRTDFGVLVRRVSDVLARSQRFAGLAGEPTRWYLPGAPEAPSAVAPTVLAAAACAETELTVPRWESSRRRAPHADFATFERLINRVLEVAKGSLAARQIADAITARLDPRRSPLSVELDVLERLPDDRAGMRTEGQVLSTIQAQEIFAELSDREKILLATWERPVRDLESVLGVARTQAAVLRQRLADELARRLADDSDADAVVHQLVELADDWLRQRTTQPGSTFIRDER
jgi:hypothetical protein